MTQDAPLHRACPQCGSSLGNDLPAGLCPRCLVREGLAILAAAGPDTTTALPVPAQGAPPAALFGDYELLGEIGRGGMGVVRHARQVSLNRMVALKMICSGGLATPAEVRRFRAEAEAAARLDHPNIVPIYDIGEQDGQHYFTMKLVEGGSLSEAIGGRPMPPRRAARLLARIARAVHFAHQHGILHRDLKPTNILLDSQDEPHLTDFGLAKFTERDSDLTRSAEVMGSASYMSPEQAAGQARQVTTATDVYSLGAVLYEALTGSPPFRGSSFVETLRQVAEAEPGSLRLLNPAIDRDLETLCRKCLEKDPRRRYASAELLALDLERWMAGETILARPCPPWDRTLKWVRRKPAVAALAALIPVVALAGLAGVLWQWRNARQTAEVLRRNLYAANINLAHRALAENNLGRAIALLDKCAPPPNGEDLRGFEWRYLRRLARGDELAVLPHNEFVETAAFSPDGRLLASVARDRTVHIWQTASRRALTNLFIPDAAVGRESSLVFSPDNRFLAACLNARKETTLLAVWNTATWACVAYWPEIRPPVFFLPDSSALVGRSTGGVVRWDTAAWRLNRDLAWPPSLRPRALSPDGRILLAEDRAQSLFQAWDIASARVLGSFPSVLPDDKIVAHAVSSGARWAATANWRGQVRLWSPAQKTEPALWTAHASPVYGLSFSPDGRLLATGGFDQVIHIWETATQQRLATLRGHLSEVWSVAFSPDGQWLASASKDATVRFWDPRPRPPEPVLTNASILLGWAEPGTRLAALKTNRSLAFWDLSTARETQAWPPPAGAASNATAVALSTGGRHIAWGTKKGAVRVQDLERGASLEWPAHSTPVNWISFSRDNRWVATASSSSVRLWHFPEARQFLHLQGTTPPTVFSPDRRRLVTGGTNFECVLWELPEGRRIASLAGHKWQVWCVVFTPDSRRLVTTSTDATVRVWDARDGRPLALLDGHKEGVASAAVSPAGRTLATGGTDDTVKLWSLDTYQELLTLPDFGEDVGELLFSPDGNSLVVGPMIGNGGRGPAQVWRAPPLRDRP